MKQYIVQHSQRSEKWNSSLNATASHENVDENFVVPLPAIILLGILGACLIIVIILYLLLRHNENKLMDKAGGKGRRMTIEYKAGLLNDEVDWDEEEQMIPVSGREFIQKHEEFYALPPVRTAVLVVSVTFSSRIGRLFVEIIQLESFAKEVMRSGIASSVSVHARLQPLPDQFRHKTSSKAISKPIFNERFAFDGFCRRDLEKCWFRFRVYSSKSLGRDKLLGQVVVGVMEFELDGIWSTLNLDVAPSEDVHRLFK